jgi:hypothetical protein
MMVPVTVSVMHYMMPIMRCMNLWLNIRIYIVTHI